jgi:adenylosuccinate synthase
VRFCDVDHPDTVLLRYALAAAGLLSGLLVSHFDVFQRGLSLKWCERYSVEPLLQGPRYVERLPLGASEDLDHQLLLTRLLQSAHPLYNAKPIRSAPDFLGRIAGVTSFPVAFCSYGSTCADVREE